MFHSNLDGCQCRSVFNTRISSAISTHEITIKLKLTLLFGIYYLCRFSVPKSAAAAAASELHDESYADATTAASSTQRPTTFLSGNESHPLGPISIQVPKVTRRGERTFQLFQLPSVQNPIGAAVPQMQPMYYAAASSPYPAHHQMQPQQHFMVGPPPAYSNTTAPQYPTGYCPPPAYQAPIYHNVAAAPAQVPPNAYKVPMSAGPQVRPHILPFNHTYLELSTWAFDES